MEGFFWGWWLYDNFFREVRGLDKAAVILRWRSFIIDWAAIILKIILWLFYFILCFIIEWTSVVNEFFFFRWRRYKHRLCFLRSEQIC